MSKKNKHRALDTIKQPKEFYYLGRAGYFVKTPANILNPNQEGTDPTPPVVDDNDMYQEWANITQPEADDTVKQKENTWNIPSVLNLESVSNENVQEIPSIDLSLETKTITGGNIIIAPNKKKAKRLYKKALEIFNGGHHKKAYKLLAKAIQLDPKTKKYFVKGDLENIYN
jgi:tetratricopeptide (TPR) repeat protein